MMSSKYVNERKEMVSNIPKEFWRYYDLYRREKISLSEYALRSNLEEKEIQRFLSIV